MEVKFIKNTEFGIKGEIRNVTPRSAAQFSQWGIIETIEIKEEKVVFETKEEKTVIITKQTHKKAKVTKAPKL